VSRSPGVKAHSHDSGLIAALEALRHQNQTTQNRRVPNQRHRAAETAALQHAKPGCPELAPPCRREGGATISRQKKVKGRLERPLEVLVRYEFIAWTQSQIPKLREEARECISNSCCAVPTPADESSVDIGQG